MILDIPSLMNELSSRRPIFHSESDFQHEFALLLREQEPTAKLRLEVPFLFEKRGATDVVVYFRSSRIGIELKYLTRKFEYQSGSEFFRLKAHGATDLRRYDVLKDVQRLERFNEEFGGPSYVVALTNDPAYWKPTPRRNTIDAAFRLCHGREVSGVCSWACHASPGSIRNREEALHLKAAYRLSWRPYADLEAHSGEFRYLLIAVE